MGGWVGQSVSQAVGRSVGWLADWSVSIGSLEVTWQLNNHYKHDKHYSHNATSYFMFCGQYITSCVLQVEVLRIEDFMAIIINEVKDYANNGVPTMSTSTLRINSAMYAGGIPSRLEGVPFTPASGVPVSNDFHRYVIA